MATRLTSYICRPVKIELLLTPIYSTNTSTVLGNSQLRGVLDVEFATKYEKDINSLQQNANYLWSEEFIVKQFETLHTT